MEEWNIKYATGQGNRDINEDRYLAQVFDGDRLLLVVCDGMGGHHFGQVAADLTVRTVKIFFISHVFSHKDNDYCSELVRNIEYTFSAFLRENPKFEGMGTTLAMAYAGKKHACFLWAGDSRIYYFRKGKALFTSRDHNLAAEMEAAGTIRKGTYEYDTRKNILTNCILGSHRPSGHSYNRLESINKNDRILLCSDGVTDILDNGFPLDRISVTSLDDASDYLEEVCNRQSNDNWTFVLAEKT